MKLKQITISGFKSFPSKTLIEFNSGITAIVGPNGCGKTNIIDALRWVMGEQSSKELRGKFMEDFIFNGSDSRKPLGMAEVSAIFEGVKYKNWKEIEVKRRFYRSGEGEFRINNLQGRLKDIQNIFANVEIVFLNRDMVRALFTSGKDKIREIFEKASEIAKYRIDKEDTLGRFEKIKQNLSELELLIGEISKRIDALKRQANRAKRYFSLQEEYKNTVIKLGILKEKRLSKEIENIQEKLAVIEKDTKTIKEEIEKNDTDISLYHYKISQKNARLKELQSIIDEYKEKLYNLGKKKAEISGKRAYLLERKDNLQKALSTPTQIPEMEIEKINAQLIDVKKNLNSLNNQKSQLLNQIKEGELSLSSLQLSFREIETRIEEKTGRKDDLITEKEKLADEIDKFNNTLGKEKRQLQDKRGKLKSLYEKESKVKEKLEKEKGQLSSVIRHIQELNINLTEEKRNRNFFIAQNNQNVKEGMSIIKKNNNKKFIGELIKVEKGYEIPVESALGEFVYAVVSSREEIIQMAKYLKEGKKGKGVFLREVPNNREIKIAKNSILNFIKEGKELVYPFLSNVYFTHSLDEGLNNIEDSKVYITPNGDIIDGYRIKAGGKEKGKIITNMAQIQEIDKKIKDINTLLKEEGQKKNSIMRNIDKLEQTLSEVSGEIQSLNKELSTYDIEFSKKELGYKNKVERLKHIQNEISALKTDIDKNLKEKGNYIKGEIEKEKKEIGKISSKISGLENAIKVENEKNNHLQELKSKQIEFNTKKIEIERILENIKKIGENISMIDDNIKQENLLQTQKIKEKEQEDKEIDALTAKSQELTEKNKKYRGKLDELLEKEESYRIDLATLEMEREENLQQIRREFEINIDKITDNVEGDEDELMDKIEALKNKIRKLQPVNQLAIKEYEDEKERLEFYTKQRDDLIIAQKDLTESIKKIDKEAKTRFFTTIDKVRLNFKRVFKELFSGGDADITVDGEDPFSCNIYIVANPEGKRLKRIDLMSSGENMLLGISLFLAIASLREYSILILDEVDAPLDELSIERFLKLLNGMKSHTQIIIITHNRRTMEESEYIYGVTMQEKGVSRVISIKSKQNEEVI